MGCTGPQIPPVLQNVHGAWISSLGDSSLANWAGVLLREPLLDAVHMVAMATVQPSHLFVSFKFFLTDTAFPFHFCCKTERAEGWLCDLPNAASNLILTQPCADIPNFVSEIEQLFVCHVINVKAPILVAIIHVHTSQQYSCLKHHDLQIQSKMRHKKLECIIYFLSKRVLPNNKVLFS